MVAGWQGRISTNTKPLLGDYAFIPQNRATVLDRRLEFRQRSELEPELLQADQKLAKNERVTCVTSNRPVAIFRASASIVSTVRMNAVCSLFAAEM